MESLSGYGTALEEAGDAPRLWGLASQVMQVRTARWVGEEPGQPADRALLGGARALEMRGRLFVDSERAYEQLSGQFQSLGYVLLLRQEGDDHKILAIPGKLPQSERPTWVPFAMFGLTVLSVLFVGAQDYAAVGEPFSLLRGWPYALSLLGILLAHEMGHYLVARWQRLPASLPYFIPLPIAFLGTLGAVIQTKAPPRNRRALLLLGAAGPIAGMVVALPVLLLGLSMSVVTVIPNVSGYWQEGNSLLYAALKYLVFGQFLPSGNVDVLIHPIALAGWAGLLVTGMNLIPAGQLDGGHIVYALLGRRARWFTWAVVAGLLGLSLIWQGWLLWVGLVLLFGRVHSVPLDDVTPLRAREKTIAAVALILFVLVFIPIPIDIK